MRGHSRNGADQSDVAGIGEVLDTFDSGTYYTQHTTSRVVTDGQILALDGSQCPCRCRVAGKNYERTAHIEHAEDSLAREVIDLVVGQVSIRSACIVTQIYVIILGEDVAYFAENRESAEATVKNAYWA